MTSALTGHWSGSGQGEQLISDHGGWRGTVQGDRADPDHLRLRESVREYSSPCINMRHDNALNSTLVGSDRGALPGLLPVGFPGPPAAPGVRL
jgi:hypothetical protein